MILGCFAIASLINRLIDFGSLDWFEWAAIPICMLLAGSGISKIEKSIK